MQERAGWAEMAGGRREGRREGRGEGTCATPYTGRAQLGSNGSCLCIMPWPTWCDSMTQPLPRKRSTGVQCQGGKQVGWEPPVRGHAWHASKLTLHRLRVHLNLASPEAAEDTSACSPERGELPAAGSERPACWSCRGMPMRAAACQRSGVPREVDLSLTFAPCIVVALSPSRPAAAASAALRHARPAAGTSRRLLQVCRWPQLSPAWVAGLASRRHPAPRRVPRVSLLIRRMDASACPVGNSAHDGRLAWHPDCRRRCAGAPLAAGHPLPTGQKFGSCLCGIGREAALPSAMAQRACLWALLLLAAATCCCAASPQVVGGKPRRTAPGSR